MNENLALIEKFYKAFQKREHAGMIACYHSDIHFSDPIFTDLEGHRAMAMWHMLCERGADLQIEYCDISANQSHGYARWEAKYTYSKARRRVHNLVEARFTFRDGKIIRHEDRFSLWRWPRLALGTIGVLLGWAPVLQDQIRSNAMKRLLTFIDAHPEYQE